MINLYHNPRCSKSRAAKEYLDENKIMYKTIHYLKTPLSPEAISQLLTKLGLSPNDIIRKDESIWKDTYKEKTFSDNELINIISQNPILMQRPIIENEKNAVVGRPLENIKKIIS